MNEPNTAIVKMSPQTSGYRVVATVAVVVAVLLASVVPLSGDDFWLQAKIGQIIWTTHAIPSTLLFPFTEIAEDHFNAHEWLMSVGFHLALKHLGEDAMAWLNGLLGVALFITMARLCYVRSQRVYWIGLLGGYVTILAENYRHVLRPELPTLILMALLWNTLEAFRSRPRMVRAGCAVMLMILWVNSHGSFVLGPILAGIYTFGIYLDECRANRTLIRTPSGLVMQFGVLTLVLAASCLANPFGWEMVQFVFSFSSKIDTSLQLTEWLPTWDPRLHTVRGLWIASCVWIALTALVVYRRTQLSGIDWLLYLAFSLLAFKAIRFPVYLGMVLAYIGSGHLLPRQPRRGESVALAAITALGALTVIAVLSFGNASSSGKLFATDKTKFSIPMVQHLSEPTMHGHVLNAMEYGAELIYRAYPRLKPAVDCRFDSYGAEYNKYLITLLYSDALLTEFVRRYDVRYLMLPQSSFEKFLQQPAWVRGDWKINFQDHLAVILERT